MRSTWGIEAGGEHRHVDQKLELARLEGVDEGVALRPRGFAGDEGGLLASGAQQAVNFAGMLDGGGEDHHPCRSAAYPAPGSGYGGDPLLTLELAVEIRLAEQAVLPRHQLAEVVVNDGGIHHARLRQITILTMKRSGSSNTQSPNSRSPWLLTMPW